MILYSHVAMSLTFHPLIYLKGHNLLQGYRHYSQKGYHSIVSKPFGLGSSSPSMSIYPFLNILSRVQNKKEKTVIYLIGLFILFWFCFATFWRLSCILFSLSTVSMFTYDLSPNTPWSICLTFQLFPGLTQFLVDLLYLLVFWTFPLFPHLHNHYLLCIV